MKTKGLFRWCSISLLLWMFMFSMLLSVQDSPSPPFPLVWPIWSGRERWTDRLWVVPVPGPSIDRWRGHLSIRPPDSPRPIPHSPIDSPRPLPRVLNQEAASSPRTIGWSLVLDLWFWFLILHLGIWLLIERYCRMSRDPLYDLWRMRVMILFSACLSLCDRLIFHHSDTPFCILIDGWKGSRDTDKEWIQRGYFLFE